MFGAHLNCKLETELCRRSVTSAINLIVTNLFKSPMLTWLQSQIDEVDDFVYGNLLIQYWKQNFMEISRSFRWENMYVLAELKSLHFARETEITDIPVK